MAAEDSELGIVCRSVVTYLESIEGVRNLHLAERVGASYLSLLSWERHHHPAQLPSDLKAFLSVSNGISLTWSVEHMGEELNLGCMHINSLEKIKRVQIDPSEMRPPPRDSSGVLAFDIDVEAHDGRVCLVYFPDAMGAPQVWFQDLSRGWYFVAETFADYFRLVIMHVGLPRWQYAFTEVGLDPVARNWLSLFARDRLDAMISERQHEPGALSTSRPAAAT